MKGLLTDPTFMAGMGILGASGPSRNPVNPWQGGLLGLQSAGQAQAYADQMEMRKQNLQMEQQKQQMAMAEIERRKAAEEARAAAMQNYMSGLTPEQQALAQANPEAFIEQQIASMGAKDRKIVKGADGYNYYADTMERVLPGITKPVDPDASEKAAKTAFDQADKLRDEFSKKAQPFIDVRDAYGRVLASTEVPSAAGDLALIFNYMKMLDPGSTVREGEFATAQNSGGVDSKIRAAYNQVLNGQRLDEVQRADFVGQADRLYASQQMSLDDLTATYTRLAESYGLPADRIALDYQSEFQKRLDERQGAETPPPSGASRVDTLRQKYPGLK